MPTDNGNRNLQHLRAAMFEQLDRLQTAGDSELDREIKRAKAMSQVADSIMGTAKLTLEANRLVGAAAPGEFFTPRKELPPAPPARKVR